jgi:hypothetical protein
MSSGETEHVVALWRLQSRYADIITRRAWDELGQVFRADTVVHLDTVTTPARDLVGPAGFVEVIEPAMARFDHFNFVILNTVVDVDDAANTAHGRIFMCEVRHERERAAWSTAYGLYQDRYERVHGRWWIAERHYRSLARTGPDEAVLGLPPRLGPLGP